MCHSENVDSQADTGQCAGHGSISGNPPPWPPSSCKGFYDWDKWRVWCSHWVPMPLSLPADQSRVDVPPPRKPSLARQACLSAIMPTCPLLRVTISVSPICSPHLVLSRGDTDTQVLLILKHQSPPFLLEPPEPQASDFPSAYAFTDVLPSGAVPSLWGLPHLLSCRNTSLPNLAPQPCCSRHGLLGSLWGLSSAL